MMEDAAKERAADLLTRTAKAVEFGCRDMATDLASFIDALPMPDEPTAKADKIADATEVYVRALSYTMAYGYALCLLSAEPIEAGKVFRSKGVQDEMKLMAMRIAESVMSK